MASKTQPPRSLEGKVAIVTGSSRGIGEAIAFDLASRGAKVVITYSSDRSRASADALISRIQAEANSKAVGVQCDSRDADAAQRIVEVALKAFGPHIDILVNNAGVNSINLLADTTAQHFDDVFALNVRAPVLLTQAVLPHLRRPGRIINIASISARHGLPSTGTYAASKAALEGYTRVWASELGGDGTTVNCVNPGYVKTEMTANIDAAIVAGMAQMTPLEHRGGKPQEIAEVVAFLAAPGSSWVTGQCISASGGFAMY